MRSRLRRDAMPMHTHPMQRPASRSPARDSAAFEIESLNGLDPGLLRRRWRALEACADIFKPAECENYFKACGYDTD
jgi:hypothetical protein